MSAAWAPRFSRDELVFSAKSFAAAMIALWIASRAGLPRPFWAMLTTYVVAAPLAGPVRSKALYRFLGTLVGCTFTVFAVPALAGSPELTTLALALWVALCLYLSLHDRTPRAYVFMLAGYTAALIGFPSVENPLALFDNAMARVEEIGLGILCAAAVHSLVLPAGLGPTLLGLLDRSLGDARRWFDDLLRADARPADRATLLGDRQRLAGDITQLRLLSTHVPFDTSHLRWTAGALGSMQDRLAGLAPALSAAEDRLQALREAEGTLTPDVVDLLGRLSAWLALRDDRDAGLVALRAALDDFGQAPLAAADAAWRRALRVALAVRLGELATRWRDCEALRARIDDGLRGAPAPLRRARSVANAALHKDSGLALLSALAAVLAICGCCAFWILTAWPSGSGAAMMAAVFCSFFAAMDDPVPAIAGFMNFTLLSVPLSALYVLVVLPAVHDFGMLVACCAPVFLLLGSYVARPATFAGAMAMLFGVGGALSMQDTQAVVDLPTFLNSQLAQLAGLGAAAMVTRLVRSVGADWSAGRIRRAAWRELGDLAGANGRAVDDGAWAVRMVDRIALLAPRIALGDATARDAVAEGALRDLRAGTDLLALRRARQALPARPVAALMDGLVAFFRERARGGPPVPTPELLARLDDALATVPAGGGSAARDATSALVGLRRTLFPDVPAPRAPAGAPA